MKRSSILSLFPIAESAQVLGAGLVILIFYSIARLAFYYANIDSFQVGGEQVLSSLITGLRFDLATLAYGSALGLLALALGAGIARSRIAFKFALLALYLPHALTLLLNLADITYFRHSFRRQTNELFTMPQEALNASSSEALEYWWLTLLSLAALGALFYSLKTVLALSARSFQNSSRNTSWKVWPLRVVLTMILIISGGYMARGGFQDRPLRTGMAFNSDNQALGQLALNTGYSIIWSRLHQNGELLNYMSSDSAIALTRDLIRNPSDSFLVESYPFLKYSGEASAAQGNETPWNVVIFIMESWNACQTGAIYGTKEYAGVTPFFDSLARDGLLFTNFYSSGDRSIHAFPAVIASTPNITGSGILHTSLETQRTRGMGSILRERGYSAIFAMGAKPSSMGFDSYAKACGFELHYSEDSYPDSLREQDSNQWGVFDERYLGFVNEKLTQSAEPFALTYFSLSAHSPFELPESYAEIYPVQSGSGAGDLDSRQLSGNRQSRALRYADYSLKKFFEAASKETYFEHTIFIITGDHTAWEERNPEYTPMQLFQVPLLIYAPGLVDPRIDSLPANQVDILPTVLQLLGGQSLNAVIGQQLLQSREHRISFSAKGSINYFLYDSLLVKATRNTVLGVYDYRLDPDLLTDLLSGSDSEGSAIEATRAYHAYLQTTMNALVDDRIFPPAQVLTELIDEVAGEE